MKKKILALVLALSVLLTGCGHTLFADRVTADSALYTRREMQRAMDVVERKFRTNFHGCILLELQYDEEKTLRAEELRAEDGETGEVIVLSSKFYVVRSEGGLTPGMLYEGWSWELERNALGGWTLTNWGYG